MNSWLYIAMHTVAAAVFIFLLQRYALNASLEFKPALGADLRRMRRGPRLHAVQTLTS